MCFPGCENIFRLTEASKPKEHECQHQRTDWDRREIFMFWGLYSPLDAEGHNSATLEQSGSWAQMECASGAPALASLTVFSFSFSAQCFSFCSLRPACLSLTQPVRPRNWWKLSVLLQSTAGSFPHALSLFPSSPWASGTNPASWTSPTVAHIKSLVCVFFLIMLFTETLGSFQSATARSFKKAAIAWVMWKGYKWGCMICFLLLTAKSQGWELLVKRSPE